MNREMRIAKRIVGGVDEWEDVVGTMGERMIDMAGAVEGGDLSGIGMIEKWRKRIREEQIEIDDMRVVREVDELLGETGEVLNRVEGERRRREDQEVSFGVRCREMGRELRELAKRYKMMVK